LIISYLGLVLASPGSGDLRHPLSNLSHRLILAPQTTANFSVAQLRVLREYLGDSLVPKLPGWSCQYSLAKFLPGRSWIDTVSLTPKGEGGVILQKPLTRLWATFSGIFQSMTQDRCSEFFNRVHKEYWLDSPFSQCALTSQPAATPFMLSDLYATPLLGHCLSVDGEDMVKTRSQRGYSWPTPMQGCE